MYLVGECLNHPPQKLRSIGFGCAVKESHMGEFGYAVNGNKRVLLAARYLHLSAVDMHKAKGRIFKLPSPEAILYSRQTAAHSLALSAL
ncbi:hypothetical protein SAMN05421548_14910 [Paraburkholderia lycopersici]|uniref:Uncharacterized protein n=1 Tax=Paraburkholderia lycopersici TaxID=416944 RepID=A0A1G7CXQ3_9BURK|nr:hypothetical protein SAMN05421548_14910 [Paraburkholderia lycopersici]